MLLMISIGFVFSYLIPTKQKSIVFPISSGQAFYAAQSGVEYAIRYSLDQAWSSGVDLLGLNNPGINQRDIGKGRFTINYDNSADILTATGETISTDAKRIVSVSNFTQFFAENLAFNPVSPPPCWSLGTRRARFFITNAGANDVTVIAFSATWTQTGAARQITRVTLGGGGQYNGSYTNGSPPENFNIGGGSRTINPGQVIEARIRWDSNLANGADIIITFYTATGTEFTFNLDPEGDGLPSC